MSKQTHNARLLLVQRPGGRKPDSTQRDCFGLCRKRRNQWCFHRPRRLPEHLTDVYRVDGNNPVIAQVVGTLIRGQLGQEGLMVGNLLAGESPLQEFMSNFHLMP